MRKQPWKKIGLLGCIFVGVGAISGSGIFGSLPTAINSAGAGAVAGLVVAFLYVLVSIVPSMYATSVIPASGSNFLFPAKLVHPAVGFFMAAQNLLQPVLISVFAVLFSDYLAALLPQIQGYETWVSLGMLAVFTGLACFGNRTVVSLNNVMVVLFLLVIGLYIVLGFGHIDPEAIRLSDILNSGANLTSFSAVVSVLSSSLSGSSSISQIADDIETPRRNIPLAMVLATTLVCVLYILTVLVTVGAKEPGELATLSDVAENFLSPGLLVFFLICGPLCGVLTSMVPVILLCVSQIEAAANCGVFPHFFTKRNRYGVPTRILVGVMAFTMVVTATGAGFGLLMTLFSLLVTLSNLAVSLVPFFLPKRYPFASRHGGLALSRKLVYAASALGVISSAYLSITTFVSLGSAVWALVGLFALLSFVYFSLRVWYLRQYRIEK